MLFFSFKLKAQSEVDSISIYFNQSEYDKALKYAVKVADYISLIEKSNQLYQNSNFQACINFSLKSIEIGKNKIDDEQKALSYQLIGFCYFQLQDFKNAILFFNKSIELGNDFFSEVDKISLINIIGNSYTELNETENAEKYYKKAISLNTAYSDKYFDSMFSLANLYCEIKDFSTAEKQSKLFLEEAKKHKGVNSKEYLFALKNLTLFYLSNDSFRLAEENALKFVDLNKTIFANNSLEYLDALSLFVQLLIKEGRLFEAEKYLSESINILIELKLGNSKEFALSLNQLATIQQNLFKYDSAKYNFLKAIEIIEKINGKENLFYAGLKENLGVLNLETDNFKEAELNLKEAIEIKQKLNNPDIFTLYHNLAAVYQKQNRCEDAEKYHLKSIQFENNKLSESYKTKIIGLALTYNCLNKTQKEFDYLLTFSNIIKDQVFEISKFMSGNEIQQYIQQYFHHRIYPLSFLTRNPEYFEKLNISCFEEELMFKSLSILLYKKLKNSINNTSDLNSQYNKYIENKKKIARLNELPSEARTKDYETLILKTENLEKYLIQNSNEFAKSKNSFSLKWNFFQEKLKPNEIILSIIDYTHYNNKKIPDSLLYSAFIIGKNYKFPKFITLFEEKQLQLLLSNYKKQEDSLGIDKQYLDKAISDLFLKPLEKELEGISTIYLSPSGLGHQINFAALPVNDNQTLGNKYKLHILSSPAELIDYSSAKFEKGNNLELLLYGGIDYDKLNSSSNIPITKTENNGSQTELQTRSGITGFGYLKGSKKEVEQISIKGVQSGFKTTLFNDRAATEESIKQLDGRTTPFILHLATHGFFFPDPIKEAPKNIFELEGKSKIYKASDDPMMRSGLLFSGANKYWGKTIENVTTEDGILTASEISNLDLSACQLVVLSACETGLGEVKGSEGVFGLQRAFKMAGVKNIIMSLWKVPDAQTAELFEIFYSECFAGKTIHEAFQSAQAKMKLKYSPYYWAGFVLLE